jgi:hypothetical protein
VFEEYHICILFRLLRFEGVRMFVYNQPSPIILLFLYLVVLGLSLPVNIDIDSRRSFCPYAGTWLRQSFLDCFTSPLYLIFNTVEDMNHVSYNIDDVRVAAGHLIHLTLIVFGEQDNFSLGVTGPTESR